MDGPRVVIRSSDNTVFKWMRSLQIRRARERERAFLVEGSRAVADALSAGGRVRVIAVRDDADDTPWLDSDGRRVLVIDRRLFGRLSDTETPQPVIAAFDLPWIDIEESPLPLYLAIDNVRDPGNLGTLLRSAAAAGVTAVVVTRGTVDPYNPKVVRAAMGAHFRLPIRRLNTDWREQLADLPNRVLAEGTAALDYDQIDWRRPSMLIVGSEAAGPSEAGRALANAAARIPLQGDVESLNAAVAGSVFLFEAAKQRRRLGR